MTLWLGLVSAISAFSVTVALFDRTTLAGMTRLWLGSAAFCFAIALLWWVRPRLRQGRVQFTPYEHISLLALTAPMAVAGTTFLGAVYASDEIHRYVYDRLYHGRLLSDSNWPIAFFAGLFVICVLVSTVRTLSASLGSGAARSDAVRSTLAGFARVLPAGLGVLGLLLSTASLSAINVNFWRYWATADGWTTLGRYPFTMTDILQVVDGGVAQFFVSFPLLPSALVVSYQLAGHNTFASYLPIVVANAALPVFVFLLIREITRNTILSFLFAALVASFPLLRNYTMDVGEADGLLMTSLALAAYLRLRADRDAGGAIWQFLAGFSAGVASLARPEGILYVIPMYMATLPGRWKERRFWLSVLLLGIVVGGFAAVSLREFGMLWPGNHSATIDPWNAFRTLEVVQRSQLFSMYASALRVPEPVLAALVVATLLATLAGTVRMLRRDRSIAYMPVVALGNVVMVFFVGPIPAEASKFHDFFRHISYGFPFLAVTVAYAVSSAAETIRGRWRGVSMLAVAAVLSALALFQIALLEGPVNPGNTSSGPVMTSDVHVTAAELLVDPYPLPVMAFRQDGGRYVPDMAEYMAVYPDDVYQYYELADVRRFDNAAEYYSAARGVFLFLLICVVLAVVGTKTSGSDRWLLRPKPVDTPNN